MTTTSTPSHLRTAALAAVVALVIALVAAPQLAAAALSFAPLSGAAPFPGGYYGAVLSDGRSLYTYGGKLSSGAAYSSLAVSDNMGRSWTEITTGLPAITHPNMFFTPASWTDGVNRGVAVAHGRLLTSCNDIATWNIMHANGTLATSAQTSGKLRAGVVSTFWRPKYSAGGVSLVIGGTQCNIGFYNDVFILNSAGVVSAGLAPFAQRSGAGIATLQRESQVIVAGGASSSGLLNDVWMGYEVANSVAPVWIRVGTLPAATTLSLVSTSDDTLFGFQAGRLDPATNSVWKSADGGATWDVIVPVVPFPARWGASIVAVGRQIVVFGGWNGTTYFNDAWTAWA